VVIEILRAIQGRHVETNVKFASYALDKGLFGQIAGKQFYISTLLKRTEESVTLASTEIVYDHQIVAVRGETGGEVIANEAGRAGYENAIHIGSLCRGVAVPLFGGYRLGFSRRRLDIRQSLP
jgi:hypothetical protein